MQGIHLIQGQGLLMHFFFNTFRLMALKLQAHCLSYQTLTYHLLLALIICMESAWVWSRLLLVFGLTLLTVANGGIVDNCCIKLTDVYFRSNLQVP